MAAELGQVEIVNFAGGMNTEVTDLLLPSSAMRLLLNVDVDILGAVRPRLGLTAVGSQVTDNKTCLGLHNFRDSGGGSNSRLISVFNNAGDTQAVTSYLNGGSWSTITGGSSFTAGARFRFRNFIDEVFVVNSAFDTPKSWDGNTGGGWDNDQLSGAPSGKFIEVFNDKLYIAATSANPDRVFFSSVPDLNGDITWTVSEDYLDVRPSDGQDITGLANNGYYLLVFKEQAFYRWNGKTTEANEIFDVGTTSQESVAKRKGLTFFFSPYGVFVTAGERPQCISLPIQRFIDAVNPAYFPFVAGACDEDNYYVSLGDMTVDDRAYSNVVAAYSISKQTWRIYTYPEQFRVFAEYKDGSGQYAILGGNDDGDVHQMNNGTDDVGSTIPYEVQTGRMHLGSFAIEKSFSQAFSFADGLPGAQTFVSTDQQPEPDNILTQQGFAAENMAVNVKGRWFQLSLRGEAKGSKRGLFHGWSLMDAGIEGTGRGNMGP